MDSLIVILTFAAISSPSTYKATSGLVGRWIASPEGLPKMGGLLLHGFVFLIVLGLVFRLIGRVTKYGDLHPFDTKTEVHRGPQLGGSWSYNAGDADK
jgi:hypothetical protein